VKRAIKVHRRDFIAIIVLFLLAIGVSSYIFAHQPAFSGIAGLFSKSYYTVYAQFNQASAVTSGQGQTVDIAGVTVGQIGGVTVQDGRAVVRMNIYKKYEPIYHNATVLLRPRTPLKDMYLELNPGTKNAGSIPNNGTLGAGATNPDVDFSEILSALDSDTRDYLLLLLAGGAQAFKDPGNPGPLPSPAAVGDLRGVFKRFAPLSRDTATLTKLLAERTQNIRRSINGLRKVTTEIGSVQGAFTSLINSSNTNFQAIASQARQVQDALTLLPGTLQQSITTSNKLVPFAVASEQSSRALIPWANALKPGLLAAQPLFKQTTPVIKNELKPFTVQVKPVAQILSPAAAKLAQATPPLARSIGVLNTLFNALAHQPHGSEQGYLFWGSWLSHVADLLTAQQDAHGPVVRGTYMASCSELQLFQVSLKESVPAIGNLLALLNAPEFDTVPNFKNGACTGG
jgi:phospholipid/cholesterol/gamma-HCH transport system substrate-binding protein